MTDSDGFYWGVLHIFPIGIVVIIILIIIDEINNNNKKKRLKGR